MNALTVCIILFTACCCNALIGPSSVLAVVSEEIRFLSDVIDDESVGEDASQLPLDPDATCNDTTFDQCNKNFAKDLNITTPVHSAKDFIKILIRIVEKEGQNGFKRICKSFNNHKKCLGNSYNACVNVAYFLKRGVKPKDAYAYVTILYEFGYECSPTALKVILANWDCINKTQSEYRWHTKKCVKDFLKSIKKRPRNICPLAQKMVTCIDFPYGRSCNQSVVTVMCNTVKAGLKVTLPKCNISCPKNLDDITDTSVLSETSVENSESNAPVEDDLTFDQQVNDPPSEDLGFVIPHPLSNDLLIQFAQQDVQSCDDAKFRKAIDHYAQLFGFEKLPLNFADFGKALYNLLQRQGKIGFKKVCQAGQEFYRRLGKDHYNLCMTQDNFESLGFSKNDAFMYLDMAAQMFYECGDGYNVFYANFDCITNVGKTATEELKKCTSDFTANMTKDPSKVCQYSQSLLCCLEGPYQEGCGADVARATCLVGKASLNHAIPTCKSLSCDAEADEEEEEEKVVHRVPLKKIHKKAFKNEDNSVRSEIGGGIRFSNLFENNDF